MEPFHIVKASLHSSRGRRVSHPLAVASEDLLSDLSREVPRDLRGRVPLGALLDSPHRGANLSPLPLAPRPASAACADVVRRPSAVQNELSVVSTAQGSKVSFVCRRQYVVGVLGEAELMALLATMRDKRVTPCSSSMLSATSGRCRGRRPCSLLRMHQ